MRKIILPISFISLMLSGCGMIDSSIRSDESIKQKTAFALGTTADKITISNRTTEVGSVRFNATFKKKVYQCYYTTALISSSDVLCSPTDGKSSSKTTQCNDLTRAAGKCN